NLRFPGQYFDAETGLHYNYFRDYDPSLGRYIQSDPIGLASGLNAYVYALNNTVRFTDPTGQVIPAVIAGCATNPACVALAGITAVALGNAISGTISALSDTLPTSIGEEPPFPDNVIPFPDSASDAGGKKQCPPDGSDKCEQERQRLENNKTIGVQGITSIKNPLLRVREYNRFARDFNISVNIHNALCPNHRVEPLPVQ
ncbi:MAG: RHS repeat-associated core domain-containing protein, partial [Nitrososphaera sp.]